MSANDLLLATMGGRTEAHRGDFSGELFEESQKANAAAPDVGGGGGGGGGGAQFDWNALEGEPGYIPNRPFGKKKMAVIPEAEYVFEMNEDMGMPMAMFESECDFGVAYNGCEFVVVYNGVEYRYIFNGTAFGNLSAMGEGEDTGEPFIIITSNPGAIIPLDGSASATVSMFAIVEESLPGEYAPEPVTIDLKAMGAPVFDVTKPYAFTVDVQTFREIVTVLKKGLFFLKLTVSCKGYLISGNDFEVTSAASRDCTLCFNSGTNLSGNYLAYTFNGPYMFFFECNYIGADGGELCLLAKSLSLITVN